MIMRVLLSCFDKLKAAYDIQITLLKRFFLWPANTTWALCVSRRLGPVRGSARSIPWPYP